ncbi:hypothetical protein JBE04_02410 [Streptomyces sp. PRKS01-29]|nr:hypothetical protein [Streptomyces sabulosicollis]MBI0293371.1 hypothetical protein [Streptomyces sabulosicollis]
MNSFYKAEAGGNDFVLMEGGPPPPERVAGAVVALCRRRWGIGADGVVWLERADADTLRVWPFDSDGSAASGCVNGLRCAARLARHLGWIREAARLETPTGTYPASIDRAGVTVRVPEPVVREVGPEEHVVTVAEDHLVLPPVDGPMMSSAAFRELCLGLRESGAKDVNIHCLAYHNAAWHLRSWELGNEVETLSCGSGTLAAACALRELGRLPDSVSFVTAGGAVLTAHPSGHAWELTGPSRVVCRGELCP